MPTHPRRTDALRTLKRGDTSGGFTLLEVLVALAVLAVVLTITYATFSATTSHINAARGGSDAFQTARIIMERLFLDLSSAVVCKTKCEDPSERRVVGPFICSGRIGTEQSFSTLAFSTTAHLALTEESAGLDLTRIEYRLVEDEETENLILMRLDDPFPGNYREKEDMFLVIGEGLKGIELIFFDSGDREHLSWDSTKAPYEGQLPVRVRLKFTVLDKDGSEYSFTSGWTLPPSNS